MRHAGGRLFVDVTERLSRPASRRAVVDALGRSDPLIRDALETVVERDDFVPLLPDEAPPAGPPGAGPGAAGTTPEPIDTDPAIVAELIEQTEASVAAAAQRLSTAMGQELPELLPAALPAMRQVPMAPRKTGRAPRRERGCEYE